jgi:hypothetical protein
MIHLFGVAATPRDLQCRMKYISLQYNLYSYSCIYRHKNGWNSLEFNKMSLCWHENILPTIFVAIGVNLNHAINAQYILHRFIATYKSMPLHHCKSAFIVHMIEHLMV